jgi:microcystin-dependent protein
MQSRSNYKEYGALKLYNKDINDWSFIRPQKIGDIKQSVALNDHNGWVLCDGRSLNREDYPRLFNMIGTSFGSASGTTFNLPDLRGRVPGNIGTGSGLTNRTMGTYAGSETHTMTINQMPSHNHGITDPGHTHSYTNNTNDQNTDNAFASETAADNLDLSANTASSTTGITVNNNGSGQAFNIMQPTLFIANTFIYAISI